MKEDFFQSQVLTKERQEELMQRSNQPALFRFVVLYSLFIGFSIWAVLAWDRALWQVVFSQIGLILCCCSIFAAEHETVHNTAFESKKMNQWAAFLLGLAHVYPSTLFRELHFTHHRYTHIPGKDPEISFGDKPVPSVISNIPMYFSWITGFPLFLFKLLMLISGAIGMPEVFRKNMFPFVRSDARKKIAIESLIVLIAHVGILLLAIFVNAGFWALFVGQILGHCLLAMYLTPEHNGLPHEGTIVDKTRTMDTNIFVKTLMWNMPYHAEHHAYPAVPFHALPQLHEAIEAELKHKDESYPSFHAKVLSRKIK